jgi:putative PEP-CTERM system histidine kinase
LGDRVSGVQFTPEDLELLRSIGDQVAAGLRNIRLSQRLVRAKELEAFQTMSAFVVHDLKNTASTLTLMLQNMAVHFDDPQFRAEAARGLGKSVTHLNELIMRLGTLRQKLELKPVEGDLNRVVASALGALKGDAQADLGQNLGALPAFRFDPAQVEKVVTNLVLNARDAVSAGGRVRVSTQRVGRWAVLAVEDSGTGMTPEFIRQSLFKPFRTTKQKGLGIGLFHCKMIVEAHQGRIEVESKPGVGTTFRVLLPLEGVTP